MPKKTAKKNDVWSLYDIQGRHFFNDDRSIAWIPELIEVQLDSYREFLTNGIDEVFNEVFPIQDYTKEKVDIYFKGHTLEEPKFSPVECQRKNLNYEAPMKVRLEMLNKETGEIKEQDVYVWGVPLMTESWTFVVNGIERVIVNQIIRSTGIFFTPSQNYLYAMKIIPQRWSWFEIEIERKGIINVKIDKKRKIPITSLLRAYGLETNAEIIEAFKDLWDEVLTRFLMPTIEKDKTQNKMDAHHLIYKLLRPGDLATDERVEELFNVTFFDTKRFDLGKIARMKMERKLWIKNNYADEDNQGKFLQLEDFLTGLKYFLNLCLEREWFETDDIDHLENRRIRSVWELVSEKVKVWLTRMERIAKDRMSIIELDEAVPGNFVNSRPLTAVLKEFFGSSQLSQFMDQTNPLSELAHKRRISAMGPGWLTRERASFEVRDVHATHYWRICPIATPEWPNIWLVLHFATYAKVDKYGFIVTPYRQVEHFVKNDAKEAINKIALGNIVSDKWDIIVKDKQYITKKDAEAIKKEVKAKKIEVRPFATSDYEYFDAFQTKVLVSAEASTQLDEFGNFAKTRISARVNTEPTITHAREVTHMDVSPKQIMSMSTSLIPFLEHDDATRAEMGTNMQRQAVPLLKAEAPTVWTWIERVIWEGSWYAVLAEEDWEVIWVDAKHITVLYKKWEKTTYELKTFRRSNENMIIHQKPIISKWDKFTKGQVLADGQSIDNWELALWKNLLVAYMPWKGYNYEDAIIISSRLIENETFTSIHLYEYSTDVRETKLGPEQTTDDIPNVSSAKLKDLSADGIVRIWAYVQWGDILVWKITPKWEQELSPEERLLRAIFWDKSKDVKDSSLRLPVGQKWKVIDVQILKRENGDNLATWVFKQVKVLIAATKKIEVWDKLAGRHGNKGIVSRIVPEEDMPFTEDGNPIDIILNPLWVVSRMNIWQILETHAWAAARKLWIKVATPVLNWMSIDQVTSLMETAGIDTDGKVQLFDWETGEPFKERTMVWVKYMLKLHHLVDHKIHARSVWPYSMVTQQPLWGKAQNWGQRFWEMEVWALEWYGAANILQEMITIKSDDIKGRTQAYEAIVKNAPIKKPNIPESFNVLIKELQALNLNISLLDQEELDYLEWGIKERYESLLNMEIEDEKEPVEEKKTKKTKKSTKKAEKTEEKVEDVTEEK